MDPGMQHLTLLQSRPQRPMETVFEIQLALPLHHVGEEIPEKGGVFIQQGVELESVLGGDQLIKAHWPWRQRSPVPWRQTVVWIGTLVADALEDHAANYMKGVVTHLDQCAACPHCLGFRHD